VQQVLTRKYISARVEKRVSDITGIPLEVLFPARYLPAKPHRRVDVSNQPDKNRNSGRA
jgi:lambda repressor-like predicted transcriptional regulator